MTACSSSRALTREKTELRATEQRKAEKNDSVVVAIRDTVREVTTITIRTNDVGDTVKTSIVRDLTRARDRDVVATSRMKTEVRVDTVYIEKRDSIEIRSRPDGQSRFAGLSTTLKWVFWIIIGLIVLVIVVRIRGRP